jgi:hypothetical protein
MNDQEYEAFLTNHLRAREDEQRRELEKNAEVIEAFKTYAFSKGVTLTNKSFSYTPITGILASAPGITSKLIGGVETERDGLYGFKALSKDFDYMPFQAGLLRSDRFVLLAHPHFRRGYHGLNNFAPLFIDLFWQFDDQSVSKYIALDDDRVRVNLDDRIYVEADTWFGAPFNENIGSIPNGISKLRPPPDIESRYISTLFANTYCLDIKWSQEGEIKTFQALELKSEEVQLKIGEETFFPARYIHAEFDISSGTFRHFDGAMQYYSASEYSARKDSDFNYNIKHHAQIKSRSRKLFKLNGPVQVKTWVELCCHFLAGNPLTFEYFSGSHPTHISEALDKIRALPQSSWDARIET